jgi:hypothetical protein
MAHRKWVLSPIVARDAERDERDVGEAEQPYIIFLATTSSFVVFVDFVVFFVAIFLIFSSFLHHLHLAIGVLQHVVPCQQSSHNI